jgi:hypothetical protein
MKRIRNRNKIRNIWKRIVWMPMLFLFLLLTACTENALEIQFHEDGSIDYHVYAGLSKKDIDADRVAEWLTHPTHMENPVQNPYFFFDDWGGDTYEIWKKQLNGSKVYLQSNTEKERLDQALLKRSTLGVVVFDEIFDALGFETADYETDKVIGFHAHKKFLSYEQLLVFTKTMKTKTMDYFNTLPYTEDELKFLSDASLSMISSLDNLTNALQLSEGSIKLNIQNVPAELKLDAVKKILADLQAQGFYSKDRLDMFKADLRLKLPQPSRMNNGKVAQNGREIEWDFMNSFAISLSMDPLKSDNVKTKSVLPTVVLISFFSVLLVALILYTDTKKNPHTGILSKFRKKDWLV